MPYRSNRKVQWKQDATDAPSGSFELLPDVYSPQLKNERDLLVYLPPSHDDATRRFPVIYMHDGQNLFDPAMSFSGAWEVDDAVAAASLQGLEAIIVGIPNMRQQRLSEYSPFDMKEYGEGHGGEYVDFLAQTVKPMIDRRFPTLPAREHTGIAGSSLGGLITLYGFFRNPETFGFAAALSPSLWLAGAAIFPFIEQAPNVRGRLYVDVGHQEGQKHVENVRLLRDVLTRKGYREGVDLRIVEDRDGHHHESAWARRFRAALPFLLTRRERRRS